MTTQPNTPASRTEAAPKAFDAFLCRAWGETDRTSAEMVTDWEGVRSFMVREWLGKEDEEVLLQLRQDFDQHEEEHNGRGGAYEIEFEIGGVSVERVCGFAYRTEQAVPSVASGAVADEQIDAAHKRFQDYMKWSKEDDRHRIEHNHDYYEREAIRHALAAPSAAIAAREQEVTDLDVERLGVPTLESELRFMHENNPLEGYKGSTLWHRVEAALASRPEPPAVAAGEKDDSPSGRYLRREITWGEYQVLAEDANVPSRPEAPPASASPATVERVTMVQVASQEDAVAEVEEIHARLGALRARLNAIAPATVAQPVEWLPTPANINTLPDPVRGYIHDLVANCDPSNMVRENTMLRDTNAGLQRMYRAAADALTEVRGCFEAAESEGLSIALAETADEHLKDLVERRLMYAFAASQNAALGAAQPCASQGCDRKEALQAAHRLGFLRAAGWMQQDHLFADVNSPTYRKDRDHDLAALSGLEHVGKEQSK